MADFLADVLGFCAYFANGYLLFIVACFVWCLFATKSVRTAFSECVSFLYAKNSDTHIIPFVAKIVRFITIVGIVFHLSTLAVPSERYAEIITQTDVFLCTSCNHYYAEYESHKIEDDVFLCDNCFAQYDQWWYPREVCEACGEDFVCDFDHTTLTCCSECYDEYTAPCSECGSVYSKWETAIFKGSDGSYRFCMNCINWNVDKFTALDPATWASDGPYNFSRIER